jgi:hypothetical protein
MLDRELLQGLLSLGGFLLFGGLILAFLQPAGSAEQVVSVCSAAMGGALVGGVILFVRLRSSRRN